MPDGYAACEVRAKFSAKQPLTRFLQRRHLLAAQGKSI